jgi:uncharacterized protein YjiS (DUF1127 family)
MNLYHDARLLGQSPQSIPQSILHQSVILLARLQRQLGRIAASRAARRRQLREVLVLYAFSDRALRDLGLSRSDLPRIRNGTYRRDGT